MRLSEKMENNSVIGVIRKFLMSKTFMIIQCLIGAVFVVLRGKNDITMLVYGDIVIAVILSIILIFCDDIMTTTLPFMLICTISIKCFDSYDYFIKCVPLAPVFIFALIFHFVVYRRKIVPGKTWPGALAVAVAVTLGGIGKISAAEYFSGTAVYHTLGLGFGLLLCYFLMNTHFVFDERYDMRKRFSFIMTLVGAFCIFMIVHHYILFLPNFLEKMSPIYFQWRNNVSTILLLTIPFGFYLSSYKYPFIFISAIEYTGILFSGSRGGVIAGTIEFLMCLIVLVYCDVKNRKKTLIIIASSVFVALTFFMKPLLHFFEPLLMRFMNGDDIREGLIERSIQDFKSNPLFGRGLGYNGNQDIHSTPKFAICWYHSSVFQVIGSFGCLGIIAYVFQLYNRLTTVFKRITQFNLTLFVGYAGLFLMSLVNPGEFCPMPYGLMATLFFILCDKNNIADINSRQASIIPQPINEVEEHG